MKYVILALTLVIGMAIPVYATETPTEQPSEIEQMEKASASANMVKIQCALTDLLVSMTHDLKDAGSAVKEGVSGSVDFAKEQIPLVLKEIITFAIIKHILWALFNIVVLVVAYKIFRSSFKWDWKRLSKSGADAGVCAGLIILVILGSMNLLALFDNIAKGIKASVAPRLYLIEYTVDLVKDMKQK